MSCMPIHRSESTELFQENVRLKRTVDELQRTESSMQRLDIDQPTSKQGSTTGYARFGRFLSKNCAVWIAVVVMVITIVAVYFMTNNYKVNILGTQAKTNTYGNAQGYSSYVGQTNDPEIQECLKDVPKKTFPDLDYALFGYNIIRGYPLAVGHDPGLTRPIFQSDYSGKRQTADCRYSLPQGLVVVPDVSCVTSFSSDVVLDAYQLSKSLSAYAKVSGGGYGVSFAASADFQKRNAEVSSKETVYVNSQAKCDYYLSKIDEMQPPRLSVSFIKKVKKIHTKQDVFDFFDYYGTHFMTQVTFGARFTYENKMTKQSFKQQSQSSVSIAAQASYSGLVRIGASAGLSLDEQKAAKNFQSKVETSTISVGAPPPASGSTLQWASTVKENPVPTKYNLISIEKLFTEQYMHDTSIDYKNMFRMINESKTEYCEYLRQQGVVDSCKKLESYTKFKGIALGGSYYRSLISDKRSCVSSCLQEEKCIGLSHLNSQCFLYDSSKTHHANSNPESVLVLLLDRLNILDVTVRIEDVYITATARTIESSLNGTECQQKCRSDLKCIVYTSPVKEDDCRLYKKTSITEDSIKYKKESFLEFQTNKTPQEHFLLFENSKRSNYDYRKWESS